MSITADNLKLAKSFGATIQIDGVYSLTADGLNALIETAKNIGREIESRARAFDDEVYDENWVMPKGYIFVPNPNAK